MDNRQLIADLLSALEYHTEQTSPIEFSKVAIEAAREYLQKPAAMDVNADLRAKLAERSAEYLAAHITYDKGYQAGRQDAEDAKYDEDEVLAETARYRAEVERLNGLRWDDQIAKLKEKNNG